MVAALYRHEGHVEVALALAEDHPSPLLVDATHLTWRTLPVAAIVKSTEEIPALVELIQEANSRVAASAHSVYRDNEFFTQRKTHRWR